MTTSRLRKTVLLVLFAGTLAFVLFDATRISTTSTKQSKLEAGRAIGTKTHSTVLARVDHQSSSPLDVKREGLGMPNGTMFVSPVTEVPLPSVTPKADVAPPAAMLYKYAGRLTFMGESTIFLSDGGYPRPVRAGEILDGGYRVESIQDSGITLVDGRAERREFISILPTP